MASNERYNEFIKPILVLVLICFFTTAALAVTYNVTDPIIVANTLASDNAARNELLPDANGEFEEYTGDLYVLEEGTVYVTEVYTATNGSGEVVTVNTNSYGGVLTEMIGIDADGAITKVKVTSASDTAGVGTKAQAESHLSQYIGLTELTDVNVKKDTSVDYVTGASVSSTAIHKGVYAALEQHKLMNGGDN